MAALVTEKIRLRFLSDAEANRLYDRHPQLGENAETYCPTCDATGTYRWKGEQHPCDCELQLQLNKHYLAAGIGATYQRLDWEDLRDDAVGQLCQQYLAKKLHDQGWGWLLYGPFGTGKTLTANLLLKDLVKSGHDCYATTFSSMIEMYTAGWKSTDERRYFERKVVHSDILLLDDIGREFKRTTKLSETTFDDVLRTRVQEGRATLITSNLAPRELTAGYGGSIFSMLSEVSFMHEFSGEDFRTDSKTRMAAVLNGEVRPIC